MEDWRRYQRRRRWQARFAAVIAWALLIMGAWIVIILGWILLVAFLTAFAR